MESKLTAGNMRTNLIYTTGPPKDSAGGDGGNQDKDD